MLELNPLCHGNLPRHTDRRSIFRNHVRRLDLTPESVAIRPIFSYVAQHSGMPVWRDIAQTQLEAEGHTGWRAICGGRPRSKRRRYLNSAST